LRSTSRDADAPPDDGAGEEVARRAVTIVRAASADDLVLPASAPVTVVSFEEADRPSLSLALRERRVRSEMLRVPLDPSAMMIEQLVALAPAQRGRRFLLLIRRAATHPAQRAALEALLAVVPDAILVALHEPFDAASFPQARTILCTYGDEAVAIDALADVLTGRSPARGRLPVRLGAAPCRS
jgi:beta-N-acetylhexosaminidase